MITNATLSNAFAAHLAMSQKQLTRSLIVPLTVGLLGNMVSYCVFSQKRLRSNSMSILFTAAAVVNIMVLVYGTGTSLYAVDHVRLDTSAAIFCRLRLYIRHVLLMTVRSYVILACIAAFSISSPRTAMRSLSNSLYVKRAILAVPCVWFAIAVHMPLSITIRKGQCISVDSYILPFAVYFLLVAGVLPVILMTFFILMTIKNLRALHRRTQPFIATPMRLKSRDRQFIRMLAALVVMYVVSNLFYPANVFYLAVTCWSEKSAEREAIESIVFEVTSNYILYINNVSPCFLFFAASAAFRRSFYYVVYRCLCHTREKKGNKRQTSIPNAPTKETRL